jgi:AcrR family transcriptional regulator
VNSRSKKVRQGEATREALLAAARAEFGARGYADTSVDEIVARAQVTKGAFYHHYSGKEDLFLRVFEHVKKELSRAAFVTHVDHVPFADPEHQPRRLKRFSEQENKEVWEQLLERCRRFIELHSDAAVRRIVLEDAPWVLSWNERQRIESEFGVTLLRADLRRAMRRGLIVDLPLRVLAVVLAGALNEACLLVANASDPRRALDETMSVVARLLAGLRAPDGIV